MITLRDMKDTMKLRKVGNSLGATFSKELLKEAGFSGDEELEVAAQEGEIMIRRTSVRLVVEFSKAEAEALAGEKLGTKAGKSALAKVRKLTEK